MKRMRLVMFGCLAILVFMVAACVPGATATPAPTAAPTAKTTTAPESTAAPKTSEPAPKPTNVAPAWQQQWEKLQAEAKKEGGLVIYASAGPTVQEGFNAAFNKNFGIKPEWLAGPSQDLVTRILNEQRMGIHSGDIWISGSNPTLPLLRPAGALEPLDAQLFLPEAVDKKAWWGGDLVWAEPSAPHYWVGLLTFPQPPMVINTDLVKPGEVTSYADLLNPKWKGKIDLYDPTKAGAGVTWFTVVVSIMGMDYVKELIKQEPVIVGDPRQQVEWVARGKYAIGLAGRTEQELEFKTAKAPIEIVSPKEGVHLTASAGGVSVLKGGPHPNAAKLFLNWILTKEGGALASKLIGGQSARLDVSAEGIDPSMVRHEGQKYLNTISEAYDMKKDEMQKIAPDVFAPLLK